MKHESTQSFNYYCTVAIGTREWRGFPSPVFGVREGV